MKYKDQYKISREFEELFKFKDKKEELDHEAHMIMFRFLSEIEKHYGAGKNLKKNELASKLGVSPSYITQLYNGEKLLNFTTLAKIQKAFDITFEIKARKNLMPSESGNLKDKTRAENFVFQIAEDKKIYRKKK